jgi:hypothetical protein
MQFNSSAENALGQLDLCGNLFLEDFLMMYRVLLVLSLLFAACSPASFGPGSRSNPLRSSISEIAKVSQNAETFVVTNGPISAISRSQADKALDPVTNNRNPTKGQKFSADVFWFRVNKVTTAPGIEVGLVAQTANREVTDVGTTTFSIRDSVDLVFSLKVASSVAPGRYPVIVELTNVDNASSIGLVLMSVEVVAVPKL